VQAAADGRQGDVDDRQVDGGHEVGRGEQREGAPAARLGGDGDPRTAYIRLAVK
jgi:hypothetical protein